MTSALVIGIGNDSRGDDAAGVLVASHVGSFGLPSIAVQESRGEPAELMESWRRSDLVYLVDACAPLGEPGRIHRFAAHEAGLPEQVGAISSHGFGLGMTIELARAMGELPKQLIVYAIEGEAFAEGTAPGPEIAAAAGRTAQRIREELAQLRIV